MGASEGNAVFAVLFSQDEKGTSFQKCLLKTIQLLSKNLCRFLNRCLCLILNHLLQIIQNL